MNLLLDPLAGNVVTKIKPHDGDTFISFLPDSGKVPTLNFGEIFVVVFSDDCEDDKWC